MPLFNDSSSDEAEVKSDQDDVLSHHTLGSVPRTLSRRGSGAGGFSSGRFKASGTPRQSTGPPLPTRRSSTPIGRREDSSSKLLGGGASRRASSASRGVRDDSPGRDHTGAHTPRVGRASVPNAGGHTLRTTSPLPLASPRQGKLLLPPSAKGRASSAGGPPAAGGGAGRDASTSLRPEHAGDEAQGASNNNNNNNSSSRYPPLPTTPVSSPPTPTSTLRHTVDRFDRLDTPASPGDDTAEDGSPNRQTSPGRRKCFARGGDSPGPANPLPPLRGDRPPRGGGGGGDMNAGAAARSGGESPTSDSIPPRATTMTDPMMFQFSDAGEAAGRSPTNGVDAGFHVASPITHVDPYLSRVDVVDVCSSGTDITEGSAVPQRRASGVSSGPETPAEQAAAEDALTLAEAKALIQQKQGEIDALQKKNEALTARLSKAEAESGRMVAQLAGVMERMNNEFEHERMMSPRKSAGRLSCGNHAAGNAAAPAGGDSRRDTPLTSPATTALAPPSMTKAAAAEQSRLEKDILAKEQRLEELEEVIAGKTAAADMAAVQREDAQMGLANVQQQTDAAESLLAKLAKKREVLEAEVKELQQSVRAEREALRACENEHKEITAAIDAHGSAAAATRDNDFEQQNSRLSLELADLKLHYAWACQVLDRLGIADPAEWNGDSAPPARMIAAAKIRATHIQSVSMSGEITI